MTGAKILAWLAEDHGPIGAENWARFAIVAAIGGTAGMAAIEAGSTAAAIFCFTLAAALPAMALGFAAAQRFARKRQSESKELNHD